MYDFNHSSYAYYRYTDWLITVPILMVEFYLILRVTSGVGIDMFQRLLVGTVFLLCSGYAGETGLMGVAPAFCISIGGWCYIMYEIVYGDAAQAAGQVSSKGVQFAFSTCRSIVVIGWLIYPLGYYIRYLIAPGSPNALAFGYESQSALNVIYNLADLVNKGFMGLAIWAAAKMDQKM